MIYSQIAARVGCKRCTAMCIPDEWSSISGNGGDRTRLTGQLMQMVLGVWRVWCRRWFYSSHGVSSRTQVFARACEARRNYAPGPQWPSPRYARPLRLHKQIRIRSGRAFARTPALMRRPRGAQPEGRQRERCKRTSFCEDPGANAPPPWSVARRATA